jgi:predicted PurR-regulated permease PerM
MATGEPPSTSTSPTPIRSGGRGAYPKQDAPAPGIGRWFALAAFALVLFLARDILPPFVIAGVLAYILSPLVDQLAARSGVSRRLTAFLVFLLIVVALGLVIWLIEARLSAEIRGLRAAGPSIVETVVNRVMGEQTLAFFGQEFTPHELAVRIDLMVRSTVAEWAGNPGGAFQTARSALELTLRMLLGLIAFAYLLIDGNRLMGFMMRFVPTDHREHVRIVTAEIHVVLGRFLQGQLLLIVVMAVVTYVVLEWGFHLPYALPIAVATGFLEVIPLLGPVIAGTIAASVGLAHGGPTEAALLALTYLILRQVEDQLIMPYIVGRTVHLHPLVTIFAVITAERIAGVLGMFLAVPVAAAIRVILEYAYPPEKPEDAVVPARERVGRH